MKHKVGDRVVMAGNLNATIYTLKLVDPDADGWLVGENSDNHYLFLNERETIPAPRPHHTLGVIEFEETGEYRPPVARDWYLTIDGRVTFEPDGGFHLKLRCIILRPIHILDANPSTNLNDTAVFLENP
jgi:hypothetical protein